MKNTTETANTIAAVAWATVAVAYAGFVVYKFTLSVIEDNRKK